MELICPLMVSLVFVTILLESMCTVGEAANIIGRKETSTVWKIQAAHVMNDSSYIKRESKGEIIDESQLPPLVCFEEACMPCGKTEPPIRCFFRGFFRVFTIGLGFIVAILVLGIFTYLSTCGRKTLTQISNRGQQSESKVPLL